MTCLQHVLEHVIHFFHLHVTGLALEIPFVKRLKKPCLIDGNVKGEYFCVATNIHDIRARDYLG